MNATYNIDWLDFEVILTKEETEAIKAVMPKRRIIIDSTTGEVERSLPEDMYYKTSSATTIKARITEYSEFENLTYISTLLLSGNPAKTNQIYNIENDVSIEKGINQLIEKFYEITGFKPLITRDKVRLRRVDINKNVKLNTKNIPERIRQLKNVPLSKKVVDIYPNGRTARLVSNMGKTLARKVSIYDKEFEFEMTTSKKIKDEAERERIRKEAEGIVRVEFKYGRKALSNLGIKRLNAGIKEQLIADLESDLAIIENGLKNESQEEVNEVMLKVGKYLESNGQLRSAEMYYLLYSSMGQIPDRLKTSQTDRYRAIFRKIGIDIYRSRD